MVEKSFNSNNHIDDDIKMSFSDDVINKAMSQNMLSKPRNNSINAILYISNIAQSMHIFFQRTNGYALLSGGQTRSWMERRPGGQTRS